MLSIYILFFTKETMKILKLILTTIFLCLFLQACSSKSQTDMIDSNTKDISELLKTLKKKEKEINELNKKLEECQKNKISQ